MVLLLLGSLTTDSINKLIDNHQRNPIGIITTMDQILDVGVNMLYTQHKTNVEVIGLTELLGNELVSSHHKNLTSLIHIQE